MTGVDLYDGYNVLSVVYDGCETFIYIGNKELFQVAKFDNIYYDDKYKVGYLIGAGSCIELERFVVKTQEQPQFLLQTSWNKYTIDQYILNLENDYTIEGYWRYLDRDFNNDKLRLGGEYKLAIIKNNDGGYDIIYCDSAKVNNSQWKCGMLKGRLKCTQFSNTFELEWYDSTMQIMKNETYAQLQDNDIITLFFPIEKCQIRFIKTK